MGFRQIVFVGVGLNNTDYFWERNPSHPAQYGFESFQHEQKDAAHETMSRLKRPFIDAEKVEAINDIRTSKGIAVSVASERPLLRQVLPLHSFEAS